MMRRQRAVRVGVVVALMLAHTAPAAAEVGSYTWNGDPIRKLGRGLANAASGVLEIPLAMSRIGREEGPMAGTFLGLCYGFGAAVTRMGVGIIEVATFPFPLPEVGYGPILEPEFLLHS